MKTSYLSVLTLFISLLVVGSAFVDIYRESHAPIVDAPESTWAPVVNPLPGRVGGLYEVNVGIGVTCFLYKGEIVDDLSCVKVLP